MINKLRHNKLGALTTDKVTPDKVNEIIDTINGGITQIGKLIGFDMNSTSDQLITLKGGTKFAITDILLINCSLSPTTADGFHINTLPATAGNNIGTISLASLSVLTSKDNFINYINGDVSQFNRQRILVGNKLYASLATPEGLAGTVDIYIYGYTLK